MDLRLYQTPDGGDISILNGIFETGAGLESAAYLSIFGGNEDDDGRDGNPLQYWGNLDETDPARQYRSEFQYLITTLPATVANLRRLEDAARRDLAWLLDAKIVSSVSVAATMPTVNRVDLTIDVAAYGEEKTFTFTENWKATA